MIRKPYVKFRLLTEDEQLDAVYGSPFNRLIGEKDRRVDGDERLANASDFELLAGTVAFSTAATLGGYYIV